MRGLRSRLAAIFLLVGFAVTLAAGGGWAQTAEQIDYKKWEKDASRAEEVLALDRSLTSTLEQVRETVADWRTQFAQAQNANAAQIATVKDQIAALGPAPTEDAPDAPEIADRRKALTDRLAQLQAPGLAAVEAHSRAEGLIRQIDTKIRARQADALLKLSPTPINPVNWPAALAVMTEGMKTLWAEMVTAWQHPSNRAELRSGLPVIFLYLLMATLFVLRGPGFMESLTGRLKFGSSPRARDIAAGLVSLGQIVVPVGGMIFLVLAMQATGMVGIRSGALIAALPIAGFAFFAARWIGSWLFRSGQNAEAGFLTDRPAEARFHVNMIGLVMAAEIFRNAFITEVRPPLSMAAKAVWATPLLCILAIFLFRLGILLRRRANQMAAMSGPTEFHIQILRLVSNAVVVISVVAPLLAIVGYVAAAEALIWPTALSLGLIGLLILLQRFGSNIYHLAVQSGENDREALVPVLIGLTLTLAAVPLFALIWGARTTDLSEAWTQFSAGIAIGDTRISPSNFLTFVLVFGALYTVTRLVQGALRTTLLPRTGLDKGVQNAVASGVGYIGIFLAALAAILAAGIDLSGLAIVAGALSVGIGFGLQNIVSNFVAGIILLIERPISEGDMIQVGNEFGIVKAISVRSTRIETFDRTDVIVPNADLVSGVVTNLTRGNLMGRLIIPIGVAYGTDTRRVETILREIAEAQPLVMVDPAPVIYFVGFGADSLNFEIRAILSDVNYKLAVQSEILHEIAARFAAEAIEIPFAQRDLWIRNPEALLGTQQRPKPKRQSSAAQEKRQTSVSPESIENDPTGDDGDHS
ncbi:MAG: mechanosensitive ion channel family protein [Rhodobacteraceae bacterium]|nr:mechanosensitive ion channel family protein [Paracoccaceae bacterium]